MACYRTRVSLMPPLHAMTKFSSWICTSFLKQKIEAPPFGDTWLWKSFPMDSLFAADKFCFVWELSLAYLLVLESPRRKNQIWLGSIIIKEKEMCTPLNLKTATNFFFHRCEDSRLWRMKCLNKILLLSLHSNLGKDHISIVCEASELSVPLLAVGKRNTQGFCFYSYNLNLGG